MRKVRIKGLPKAAHGGENQGGTGKALSRFMEGISSNTSSNQFGEKPFAVNKSISAVPRSESNVEAEGGEFAVVPGEGGIPESYKINGPKHNAGGVPLNLAEDSFIFSDTKHMKIKDKDILAEFGMSVPKKGKSKGYTPADIAKKYDINKYKQILLDPNSDKLARETAERMIENYNLKLGKLALVQESSKGFPQDIPTIAMPYLESIGVDPNMFKPQGEPEQPIAQRGGQFTGAFWKSIMQKGGTVDEASYYDEQDFFKGQPTQEMTYEELQQANEFMRGPRRRPLSDLNKYIGQTPDQPVDINTYSNLEDILNGPINPLTGKIWGGIDPGFSGETRESATAKEKKAYKEQLALEKLAGTTNNTQSVAQPINTNKEVATSTKPTAKSNLPKDAVIHTEGSDKYNESQVKAGEYVRRKDGKLYKVSGNSKRELPKYKGEDLKNTFGDDITGQGVANKYQFLEETFKDPEIKKAFAEKTRAALKNDNYYKRKKGATSKRGFLSDEQIDKLTDDEIVKNHLNMQKRNYAFAAKQINPKHFDDRTGNVKPEFEDRYGKGSNLQKIAESMGVPIGEQGKTPSIGIEQASYLGFNDLLKEKSNLPQEIQDKLSPFKPNAQIGSKDEPLGGISPIDLWYTDTSAGQLDIIDDQGNISYEEVPEEVKAKEDIPTAENLDYINQSTDAPWWAQDWGNLMMTVGERAGLKKYLPWSQQVHLAKPDVLYYDPSRALAANAEQANLAMQANNAFAGPQAGSARNSAIAGDAFARAANVLADYENRNVGVGNQYLDKVQQTANTEATANAQRLQTLFDQNTIANQQFDNSKTAANRNIFDAWRQGLTNATETQSMNLLYPQFQVNPWSGGTTSFTQGRDFARYSPTGSGASDHNDAYFKEVARLKEKYPNIDDKVIAERLSGNFNITDPSSVNSNLNRFIGDARGTRNKTGRRFRN